MAKDDPSKAFIQYSKALQSLGRAELPLAARGTLNRMAYLTREQWADVEMPKAFTVRNRFETRQTTKYEGAGGTLDMSKMVSTAGQLRNAKFAKGNRPMRDMFQQEMGRARGPRQGQKMLRVPTKEARISKSHNRPVARQNRPSKGEDWITMKQIERNMGLLKPRRFAGRGGRAMPLKSRVGRAHALMIKNAGIVGQTKYTLPSVRNPAGEAHVFKLIGGKPVLLHVLKKKKNQLKKTPTLKPAFTQVMKKKEEIFFEQADRRVKKAMDKFLVRGR